MLQREREREVEERWVSFRERDWLKREMEVEDCRERWLEVVSDGKTEGKVKKP